MRRVRGSVWSLVAIACIAFACATAEPSINLGICVTGQLARLDFWSKVHNLLVPNMDTMHIDIVFRIQMGQLNVVSHRLYPHISINASDIPAAVHRHCPSCGVAVVPGHSTKSVILSNLYVNDLVKTVASMRPRRASMNTQMLASWADCLGSFGQHFDTRYDVFLRLRDDLFVLHPMKISPKLWRGHVAVTDRCGSDGYNDHSAILDARYGFQYFVGPLLNMYLRYSEMRNTSYIRNTETLVKASLAFDNVPVNIVLPDELPVAVVRQPREDCYCLWKGIEKAGHNLNCITKGGHDFFKKYSCGQSCDLQDSERFLLEFDAQQ